VVEAARAAWSGPLVAAGDGLSLVRGTLAKAQLAESEVALPSGRALAQLGALLSPQPLRSVAPDYRRPPDAVRNLRRTLEAVR